MNTLPMTPTTNLGRILGNAIEAQQRPEPLPTTVTRDEALVLCEKLAETLAERRHQAETALIDVRYAIKQIRDHGDLYRSMDALERAEEALASACGARPS